MCGNLPEEIGKGQRYAIASGSQYGCEQDAGKMMREGIGVGVAGRNFGERFGGCGYYENRISKVGLPKSKFRFYMTSALTY